MVSNIIKIVCGLVCVINAASSQLIEVNASALQCDIGLSNPEVVTCLLDAIQSVLPDLATGIPDLGINQLEPLRIPELELGVQTDAEVKVALKDVDINDLTLAKVVSVQFDPVNYIIDIVFDNPTGIEVGGDLDVYANVLSLPIIANGTFNISLDVTTSVVSIKLNPIAVNGEVYFEITSLLWNFTNLKLSVKFYTNVVDEIQLLKTTTIETLEKTVNEVLTQSESAIESALANAIKVELQAFLSIVPANQIFLGLSIINDLKLTTLLPPVVIPKVI